MEAIGGGDGGGARTAAGARRGGAKTVTDGEPILDRAVPNVFRG